MAAVLNVVALVAGAIALVPMLETLFAPPADQITTVRVTLGLPVNISTASLGGNVPGVALWDRFGQSIGTSFGSGVILQEGNFHDIKIAANPAVGNVPAEYISITNGGDDAICIASLSVTFADGSKAGWTGDVAEQCPDTGAFIFQSSRQIVKSSDGSIQSPHCVWIDRNGSNGIPHQGFGIHLSDFGDQLTPAQLDVYTKKKAVMCQSGPRFRMYQQLRAEDPILTFSPPLNRSADGTDFDPSLVINNPGVFAEQDETALRRACDGENRPSRCPPRDEEAAPNIKKRADQVSGPRHRDHPRHYPLPQDYIHSQSAFMTSFVGVAASGHRTHSPSILLKTSPTVFAPIPTSSVINSRPKDSVVSGNGSGRHRFHGNLIVSSQEYHSAKGLCEHPNSFGPSMASTHDGWFCDMVEKRLYPICERKNDANDGKTDGIVSGSCCFDIDQKELVGCSDNAVLSSISVNVAKRVEEPLASESTRSGTYTAVDYW